MLLCDIGNTSYHFLDALKDYKKSVTAFNPLSIEEKVYYICVNPTVKEILKDTKNWIDLSKYVDMKNYYETMGVDRIFACEAVSNAVIVDAGSAITVDIVRDGVFEGGFIYPGVRAMHQSYKSISSALDYEFNFDMNLALLPKNSQDAISYGFLKPFLSEVLSYDLPIILTGGDAQKLSLLFKNSNLDEQIVFNSMKKIISLYNLV